VPYGAFGQTTYLQNTFVEAAINLTEMISDIFDVCTSIGVKAIVVKTKTSAARSANLADFLMPLNVDLTIGIADAGENQIKCATGNATEFALLGTSNPGTNQVESMHWSVVSGSATLSSPASCDDCTSLPLTVNVTSPTALLRLSVVLDTGCTVTDHVVLTVQADPPCAITLHSQIIAGHTSSVTGPAGDFSYAWSISYNGGPTNAIGSDSRTLEIPVPSGATGTIAIGLTVTSSAGCATTCTRIENILLAPCTVSDNPAGCPGAAQTFALDQALYPAGATVEWSFTGNEGGAWFAGGNTGFSIQINATNSAWFSIEAVISLDGEVLSTCSAFGSFLDVEAPAILAFPQGAHLGCNPATLPTSASVRQEVIVSDNCPDPIIEVLYEDGVFGCLLTRTFTITAKDLAGNVSAPETVIYTWTGDIAPPAVVCPAHKAVECGTPWTFDPPTGATDACGPVTVVISSTTTNAAGHCGGTFTATRVWTITDECLNSVTCTQVVTVVDTTAPTLSCAPNKSVSSGTPWEFEPPAYSDLCGPVVLSVLSTVTNVSCGNNFIATRTWLATDDCGNTNLCSQSVEVFDTTTDPVICAPSKTVECGTSWNFDSPAYSGASVVIVGTTTNLLCGNTFSATRTWRATDACGNTSECSQTVTMIDTTAPVFTFVPGAEVVQCPATPLFGTPIAGDSCGHVSISVLGQDQVSEGACPGAYTITRTWKASDACGNEAVASQTIRVECEPLRILNSPAQTAACEREAVTLTVSAAGSAPFSIQWRKDLAPITGATNSSFQIASMSTLDQGDYDVVITNPCGSITSATAQVSMQLETVATALNHLSRCTGESATFTTTASGSGPFTYAWRKNGILLSGQTANTLTLPSITAADEGTYSVEVTGLCSAVTHSATLSISTPVSASPLSSQRVCTGASPTFSTVAGGSGPFRYTWRIGANAIPDGTNSVLTLHHVTTVHSGEISVEVAGPCNTVTQSAILTVVPEVTANPLVLANPASIRINDFGPATPYPSSIEAECIPGDIEKITVRLDRLSHSFATDVQMLLVAPNGQSVELMASTGGDFLIENATLVFDDDAGQLLPEHTQITSGVYKPTVYGTGSPFPDPAPATGRLAGLSGLQGASPNGTWSLYISDVQRLDLGRVEGGWSLSIGWRRQEAKQAPELTGSLVQQDGLYRLVLSGEPDTPHVIEASDDLLTWIPVSTNTPNPFAEIMIDMNNHGSRQMFFRAVRSR
jgi:subtilisin-like proprotein convertase family protein